jgi:cytochrome c biogenesis protein CcmG/thiol:disulfide interchange protein DsbE
MSIFKLIEVGKMTNRTWIALLFAVLLIVAIGYGYLFQNDTDSKNVLTSQSKENKEKAKYPQAPDFTLNNLEGSSVSLSDFRGKVVIIDFWATWCPPCRKGIPDFVEMQIEYGEDELVVLGINMDQGDLSIVPKFAEEYDINYPVLYFTPQVAMAYGGIQSIPTTFIVDRDGYVRHGVRGYQPKQYFKSIIDTLL